MKITAVARHLSQLRGGALGGLKRWNWEIGEYKKKKPGWGRGRGLPETYLYGECKGSVIFFKF